MINIITKVTYDVRHFVMIFLIIEFAFIMAYYCVGKNQQDWAIENDQPMSLFDQSKLA